MSAKVLRPTKEKDGIRKPRDNPRKPRQITPNANEPRSLVFLLCRKVTSSIGIVGFPTPYMEGFFLDASANYNFLISACGFGGRPVSWVRSVECIFCL